METGKPPGTVNVKFRESKTFQMVAANGAWGGPTPQGDIICHFFIDGQALPESVQMEIDPVTRAMVTKSASGTNAIIREVQVAVMMRPDIAKAVGLWLIKKADEVIGSSAAVKQGK